MDSIKFKPVLIAALTLAFAGCAENRYCATPAPYESAPSIPTIQSVGDVKVTLNPDAYVIPPPPAQSVPFGWRVPDSKKTRYSCLDQPLPLALPKAPAAPAPAAKS